ncbi:MAG: TRAP transporter small permease subunit [Pseudomonadota bacterium]
MIRRKAARAARALQVVLDGALVLMMVVMTAAITIQVFGRYLRDELEMLGLYFAGPWTDEVARFLMAWITMIGSAAVMRNEGQIEITFMTDRLPGVLKTFAALLRDVIIVALMGFLAFLGTQYVALGQAEFSSAMEISMAWPYAAIPVGAGLIVVTHLLARLAPDEPAR